MVIIGAGRVMAWSSEAERATGISSGTAVGKPCHEVLALADVSGRPICTADCPIAHGRHIPAAGERTDATRPGISGSLAMWTATGSCGDRRVVVHTLRRGPDRARSPLTRRQIEILGLVARGMSTAEIATALYLSTATVRNHIAHILDRLGARTRAQAVSRAGDLGLLGAPATWQADPPAA
jgi:DNA-binding CsgD family transcriptional regulator